MSVMQTPTTRILAWGHVAAAIALVADGRYPQVVIANVDDAGRLAAALRPDAERCGVDLVVESGAVGDTRLVARRR